MIKIYAPDKYYIIKVSDDKCERVYSDSEKILPVLEDSEITFNNEKITVKADSIIIFYSVRVDNGWEERHLVIENGKEYCDSVRDEINRRKQRAKSTCCGDCECCDDCCICEKA